MIVADRVAAVLLAAGRSRRFGEADKLLAPLEGRPLALHAAATLSSVAFGTRIAICAPDAAELGELLADQGFDVIRAIRDADMSHSLIRGVAAAEAAGMDAMLICLADMPYVPVSHIRALLEAHDGADETIIASSDGGLAMPPALFGRARFASIRDLDGDRGARPLLADAKHVRLPSRLLRDIDRPADLLPDPG